MAREKRRFLCDTRAVRQAEAMDLPVRGQDDGVPIHAQSSRKMDCTDVMHVSVCSKVVPRPMRHTWELPVTRELGQNGRIVPHRR